MGAMPWLAHTQRDFAQLLLVRNQRGDRERGLDVIGEAIRGFRKLSMDNWAAEANELQRALESAPRH